MVRIKDNKYFLFVFFIIILFFSSHVLADDHFTITFNQQEEWELTCGDFKSANFNDSKKYTKEKVFPIVLKKAHDIPRSVYDDHLFTFSDGKSNQPELIFYDNADKSNEITDKVYDAAKTDKNNVFCFPNEKDEVPEHLLIVKINPITFFTISCFKPNAKITAVEMSGKIKENYNDFNEEDLVSEIYDYTGGTNRLNDVLQCNKIPIQKKFFYKKLANTSELNFDDYSKDVDESSPVTQSNDEPEIASCDTFDTETLREKVNSDERSDCANVLIQREEEIRQQKIIKEEITSNKSKLSKLLNVLNNTNLPEVINQKSFADFEAKIESLKDDLENLNEIQIIDEEFTKLNEEINNLRLYFDLFDSYRGICDDETSLNSTDKSNYVELCDQIVKLDNDINNDFEDVKEYIANREYLLLKVDVKLTSLEESIDDRKNQIKAFKELVEDLEKEKNSIIESIRDIKSKQENLINDINTEISKLESQNNIFDKTKVFLEHINFAKDFQNDNFDLETEIENIKQKIDNYNKDDKKIFYNEVETLEEYINDTDILINKYNNEYERYENNLLERQDWQEEQNKIAKKEAEKKAAQKLLKKQEREDEKIKNTINEIKIIEDKINQLIRDYKNYLESSYSEISNFNKNFDPTDTNVINFDSINKEIKRQEKIINKNIKEYSDLVTKLPKDYDDKKFNFNSIKELSKTEERFKIKLEDINDKELNKLNTQIDDAKFKIDTREDQLGEIVTQTTEELSQKDKLLETTVNELNQREELIIEKKNTIVNLQNEIEKLKDDIKFEKNIYRQDIGSKNMIIYLLIGLSIILSGSLIYFIIRKKPTSNNNSENYISKIDELEKKLENEIKQSRLQANSQKIMTEEPVIAENKQREPTLQEIKNENLKKLYEEYNDSMKNPNLIEKFQTNYNAIGLERESKISTGRNVRLRKVNTSFDRAIFWVVEHDNKLLVFGGRMLKVQAPSLLANDGTMARDLLQGIFELQTGPDLRTHKCAVVRKNNQIYEVIIEGTLQLPKID